jgi:hypothetical protein
VVLRPLSAADVEAAMNCTLLDDGRSMAVTVGVPAGLLPYFADKAARLTAGLPRTLHALLSDRQWHAQDDSPRLTTPSEVALEERMLWLRDANGWMQRIRWETAVSASQEGAVPEWVRDGGQQPRLVQLLVRWLLLDAPPDRTTLVASGVHPSARLVDVAVALGLSYGPAEEASSGYESAEGAIRGSV